MPRPSFAASSAVTMPNETRARVRLLIVDDEELVCRSLQRLLQLDRGFQVYCATSCASAVRLFETEGPFDVLLTDLCLPGLGGVGLADELLQRHPALKVLFMSGELPADFLSAHGALEKPFDRDLLLRALEAALAPPHRELV